MPSDADRPPRRRAAVAAGALVVLAFLVYVGFSAQRAAVPVGSSGGMPGMSMGNGAGMSMTVRDVRGRPLRIPDGRPGVAVFVSGRTCAACLAAVRRAAAAIGATRGRADLMVVSLDSTTTRGEADAFAQDAGRPAARYVVDDPGSSLASMFGVSTPAQTVVYDDKGAVVARLEGGRAAVAGALRRAREPRS